MADLSSAAAAVLDAVTLKRWDVPHQACPKSIDQIKSDVAAALRAAADQAQASVYSSAPSTDWGQGWKEGVRNTAQGLRAIAAELEGQ